MSISSLQLDAFFAVAKALNFSKAAKQLHITQSALSQRVKNLEEALGVTLFIREQSGIRLTDFGYRLLRYSQSKNILEQDLMSDIKSDNKNELSGIIGIGAFSSVLRSIIIPALSPLIRKHPKIQCNFIQSDMHNLPEMLKNAAVDFVVLDYGMDVPAISEHILGYEEYVVIESSKYRSPEDTFLDNTPDDKATENFFKSQKTKIKYRRIFMGETYSILTGVEEGLGRAVMPRHLFSDKKNVRIVSGFKPFHRAITLHHYTQSFYPKPHQAVIDELINNCKKFTSFD